MRNLFAAFLLTFFIIPCHANISSEYIKKYSYHVVGMIGNRPIVGGTGFFVKHNSKYFLVSAWHCFKFKNRLTKEFANSESKNIANIVVYRNLADIRPDKYMRIDVASPIDNSHFLERRKNDTLLDISAIEIQRQKPFEFDYIDFDSLDTNNIEVNDSIIYYGFPIINNDQVDTAHFFSGSVISADKYRDEFTIKIEGYTGCSGSPVFSIKGERINLKGLLFYGLKDNTGKATECKALHIRQLRELLIEN